MFTYNEPEEQRRRHYRVLIRPGDELNLRIADERLQLRDISAGGCSFRQPAVIPLRQGQRIKARISSKQHPDLELKLELELCRLQQGYWHARILTSNGKDFNLLCALLNEVQQEHIRHDQQHSNSPN